MAEARAAIMGARRIVVKFGSAMLPSGGSSDAVFQSYANDILRVREQDRHVVVVSSGAVSQGVARMGYETRPSGLAMHQSLAAIGQPVLMDKWARAFAPMPVAQFLLSKRDTSHPTAFMNARRAMRALRQCGVVPIGNENDTVATEEIKIGDNDNLASHVAKAANADLVVVLTQVEGLYTANPEKDSTSRLLHTVQGDEEMAAAAEYAGEAGGDGLGTGGFVTKLQAVHTAHEAGIPVVIANGAHRNIVQRLLDGELLGTLFLPSANTENTWIANKYPLCGGLVLGDSLANELLSSGPNPSILMKDIASVQGHFKRGEMVSIRHESGTVLGRGMVGYSSKEVDIYKNMSDKAVCEAMGRKAYDHDVLHPEDYVTRSD